MREPAGGLLAGRPADQLIVYGAGVRLYRAICVSCGRDPERPGPASVFGPAHPPDCRGVLWNS